MSNGIWMFIGTVAGAVAGWNYQDLSVPAHHAIIGATIGLAVSLVLRTLLDPKKNLVWKSAKITIPLVGETEFEVVDREERTFAITDEQRKVGWRIYVQLVSRVSLQPITNDTGSLRGGLGSLHALMQSIRQELAALPPTAPPDRQMPTIEVLATWTLNAVRAVLAKWHQRLQEYEARHLTEVDFPEGVACRADLTALQKTLQGYASALSQLIGVQAPEAFLPPHGSARSKS